MRALLQIAGALFRNRRAATAVEYGFLLALIVLAMMAALVEFGSTASDMWRNISDKVQGTN